MNPEIFIRTYAGDALWLDWCLKSICKNAPTLPITLVAPESDREVVKRVAEKYDVYVHGVTPVHKEGYMDQQWSKIHADVFCRDASHIIHVDSDCLWTNPDWQKELFKNGKPIAYKTSYRSLEGSGAIHWQGITESALGFGIDYEYMRRHPAVYPREIYERLKEHLGARHNGLKGWYSGLKDRRFSEFNALGAFADRFFSQDFHWIDTDGDILPEKVVEQGWSWGGFGEVERKRWEELL